MGVRGVGWVQGVMVSSDCSVYFSNKFVFWLQFGGGGGVLNTKSKSITALPYATCEVKRAQWGARRLFCLSFLKVHRL